MYPHFADCDIHCIEAASRGIGHRHADHTGLCCPTVAAAATSGEKNSQQESHQPCERLILILDRHASLPVDRKRVDHISNRTFRWRSNERADSRSLEQTKPRSMSKFHAISFASSKTTCPALMESTRCHQCGLQRCEKTMVYS